MNASELLRSLQEEGVQLWREGEELRYRAPKRLLSVGLIEALAARKPEIVQLLQPLLVAEPCFQTWSPPLPDSQEAYPLSFAQQRMWFLKQLEPDGCSLNVAMGFSLSGPLDVPALECSLGELIDRHEAFRTTCAVKDAQPLQIVVPAGGSRMPLEIVDLRTIPETERESELQRLVTLEARRPFALDRSPLLHATLFQVAEDRHALLLTTHHFVVDGWSVGVMLRDLSTLYDANCNGRRPSLETLTCRYCDYAIWQRERLSGQLLEELLGYWKGKLGGAAELNLPTDRPMSGSPSGRGATHRFDLPSDLSVALKVFSRREGVTLFTTLLAAFKTLLHRYSRQNDIVVGTAVSDRCMAKTQTLVGCFANTLVLRTRCDGNPTFRQLLRRVHDAAIEAFDHQDMPFEVLVEQLRPERRHVRNPLFKVSFVLHQHADDQSLKLTGVEVQRLRVDLGMSRFDLLLEFQNQGEQLSGLLEYSADLFESATIERMARHFEILLEGMLREPDLPVARVPMLTEREREWFSSQWNGDGLETPVNGCVQSFFAAQAKAHPDAMAMAMGGERMSYGELQAKSDQLALALRTQGIGRGVLAGICMEPCFERIISVLGVLKAGGAYVPLDPHYPADRIDFMVEDSGMRVLLTQQRLAGRLSRHRESMLCIDDPALIESGGVWSPVAPEAGPDDLAYVIYTSGSTGRPKGVMIAHRGLCNLALAQSEAFGIRAQSRVLQFASFSFDASVSEIFTALVSGATLVMGTREELLPGPNLARFLRTRRVNVATIPPSLLRLLPEADYPDLETLISAGEACTADLVERWAPGRRFINAYGPTEATVCATLGECQASTGRSPDIGRPLRNTRALILDGHLEPVPIGVVGELFVGGVGVALGYLNRPELIDERFLADPFSSEPGSRLYRTGDLARYLNDGRIEYLGRADDQVKLRGYRIELGEIENALLDQSGVVQAAVRLFSDEIHEQRLVAYVVPREDQDSSGLELWPSTAEFLIYDELLYHAMTHDERRNESYRRALRALVHDRIVLDIGTGPEALLARLALESGARKVYAVELLDSTYRQASQCLESLGLRERIHLVRGDIRSVQLPELAEVCVSEIVGPIGGVEGAALLINSARRLLVPGGAMIPGRSRTKMAALSLPESFTQRPAFSELTAHYVQSIFDQVGYRFDLRLCLKNLQPGHVVSTADIFEDLDFQNPVPLEASHEIELRITRDAQVQGFVVWLTLETFPGEEIDILAHEHCWLPVFLPVFDPSVAAEAGDILRGRVSRSLCDNGLNPDFRVEGVIERQGSTMAAFCWDSFHNQRSFRASPFYQRLFAQGEIPVAKPLSRIKLNLSAVREGLLRRLPDYMIPSAFVVLDKLPLTPNGKIDRQALPAPERSVDVYRAPRTPQEEILCEIFANLLSVERVGIDDDFFELGGHSLLALQMVMTLRNILHVEIAVTAVFEHPTILDLGGHLDEVIAQNLATVRPPMEKISRDLPLPLSFAQQRLWRNERAAADSSNLNVMVFTVDGELDVSSLERSLEELVRRHEIFRTTFHFIDGQPVQRVARERDFRLGFRDLREIPDPEGETRRLLFAEKTSGLNLEQGPLMRAYVLCWAPNHHKLVLTLHHMAYDVWSLPIFFNELHALYAAFSAGKASPLTALRVQQADFAVWQRTYLDPHATTYQAHLAFWLKQLSGNPILRLPCERPRPLETASIDDVLARFEMSAELSTGIRELSRQEGATLFMTFLAALKALINLLTGQNEIMVGTYMANRSAPGSENMMGYFCDIGLLRTTLSSDLSFLEVLRRVRETVLNAHAHEDMPFEVFGDEMEKRGYGWPAIRAMFMVGTSPTKPFRLGDLEMTPLSGDDVKTMMPWNFQMGVHDGGCAFSGRAKFDSCQHDPHLVRRMVRNYVRLLEAFVKKPTLRLSSLEERLLGR